jgi:enoyl-CoA hydratase
MTNWAHFRCDEQEHLAVLTLNQPDVLNRFSAEMLSEFLEVIAQIEANPHLHALIITGAGKAFAAGADIRQMAAFDKDQAMEFSRLGQTVFDRIEGLPAITVAAVNGAAVGGGCELALACDFRIAAENAKIGQAEVRIGLIPGWGGARRLVRTIGLPAARDLIFSGRLLSSEEAMRAGLVDQVVAPGTVVEAAKRFIETLLASSSPAALRLAKQALWAGVSLPDDQAELRERALFGGCFETKDCREGFNAFLEKRPPSFQGE